MRRSIKLGVTFAVLAIAAATIGVAFLSYNYLPRTAKLSDVKRAVTPVLKRQLAAKGMTFGSEVFIRVFKVSSELELWVKKDKRFALFKTYAICNYSGALGPKLKEGDRQSPEGIYVVRQQQLNPKSSYHLSFNLGFPNAYDQARGRTGSFLMIHGACVSIGCYAMTDEGIEEIYLMTEAALQKVDAVHVHAFPFRLTPENLQRHKAAQWIEFWRNLKEGYDHFERLRVPPAVRVENARYQFARRG